MIRRTSRLVALLALLLSLSGCFVVSLNPLFRDRDLVFEPGLIGRWTTPCSSEDEKPSICVMLIASADQKTYSLEYTDEKGASVKFDAYLGRIGENLYLDVVPQDSERAPVAEAAREHALFAHSFWKISLKKDELTLASLDSGAELEKALRKAGMRVAMKRSASQWKNDYDVLLGSTPELQRFLAVYGAKPEAWDREPAAWRRQ